MADCTEILADLVRRPSVNPMGCALSGPEYLEGRVTEYLLNRLGKVGINAVRQHVSPGTRKCGGCVASHQVGLHQCFFGMPTRTQCLLMA